MMASKTVLIIGAGQAGLQTAVSLRQGGFEGTINIVGDEQVLPYQRPPLSKAYLKGEIEVARLYLKPEEWYRAHNVTVHTNARITSIQLDRNITKTEDGRKFAFDYLVFATGARNRQLHIDSIIDHKNAFSLRTSADVDKLRPYLGPEKKLVVIGAGYIGLETAAVARALGTDVTVLELADRVLARVTSPVVSGFYEKLHRKHGVDIRTATSLGTIDSVNGIIKSITLPSGHVLNCDVLLIGIGILPNIELAKGAGVVCEEGIIVNDQARTNIPHVYAAGDCTKRMILPYGHKGRLESVHNAIEQGKQVAASILDLPTPKIDCPWFWSDQYDVKLQIAGLSSGYDTFVIRGAIEYKKFAVFYFQNKKLIAVDAINSAPEFMVGKKLILEECLLDPAIISDHNISMKAIAQMYKV